MKLFSVLFASIVVILLLLPFVYNTIAATPSYDDICYFSYVRHQILDGECTVTVYAPSWAQISPVISFVVARYYDWSGRFFSDFLIANWLSLPIDIIQSYATVLYILLGVYGIVLYIFFRTFLASPVHALGASLFVVISTFLLTPDIPQTEYWITSILTYRMAVLCGVCFAVYMYRLFRMRRASETKVYMRILHYCILFVGGVCLCGFNESFMLVILLLAVALFLATCFGTQRGLAVSVVLGVLVGTAIVFLSPGNDTRILAEYNPFTNNIIFAIFVSFAAAIVYSALFCFVLLLLHTLKPFKFRLVMRRMRHKNPALFLHSSSLSLILCCLTYIFIPMAYIFPLVWGLGAVGPLRTHGQIILTMLLYAPFAYNSLLVLYERGAFPRLLQNALRYMRALLSGRSILARASYSALAILFCAVVFFGVPVGAQSFQTIADDNLLVHSVEQRVRIGHIILAALSEYFQGNLRNSYGDMLRRTNAHLREVQMRYAIVVEANRSGLDKVVLAPFSAPPKTVFVADIRTYASQNNLGYALMHAGSPRIMPILFWHPK